MLEVWSAIAPLLPLMLLLLLLSGFTSGSEAAYFSLSLSQRREMAKSGAAERTAEALLAKPERLLMGVLFWNLAVNIGYFTLVSRGSLQLEETLGGARGASAGAAFAFLSLLMIILFGEFLPKSLAILQPRRIAKHVALPLTMAVRAIDGILPVLRFVNEYSRRLIWPGFKPEPYLQTTDLERAIELTGSDQPLYEHERQVLRNIVQLREIRVEEWMRPRTQYKSFIPPLNLSQLDGEMTDCRYMLVTDKKGIDLMASIDLAEMLPDSAQELSQLKKPLVVVPWCASIATALQKLRETDRRVAVVVNEFGETMGVLTWDDIFESILQLDSVPSHRERARGDVQAESPGVWVATGMTSLRRLERMIGRQLMDTKNLTVGGLIQEQLRRMAVTGDVCKFGAVEMHVIEAGRRGEILVRLKVQEPSEEVMS